MDLKALLVFAIVGMSFFATGVVAQGNATQEDVQASEARLRQDISNMTVAMNVLLQVLQQRVTALENSTNTSSTSLVGLQATMSSALSNLTGLAALVTTGRNDTLDENQLIYSALTNGTGDPFLPGVSERVNTLADSQLRLRGDMEGISAAMSDAFEEQTKANNAMFQTQSSMESAVAMMQWLVIGQTIVIIILVSVVTKRPRKLWRKLTYAKRMVDERGGAVDPPCPEADHGLQFGDYFQCPVGAKCPIGARCKDRAEVLTAQALQNEGTANAVADEFDTEQEVLHDDKGKEVVLVKPKTTVNFEDLGA